MSTKSIVQIGDVLTKARVEFRFDELRRPWRQVHFLLPDVMPIFGYHYRDPVDGSMVLSDFAQKVVRLHVPRDYSKIGTRGWGVFLAEGFAIRIGTEVWWKVWGIMREED